jgi:hypothetical protein
LYKTADGCRSWKLVLKNADKDGFWDAVYFERGRFGWLLGDPVDGAFTLFVSSDAGQHWTRQRNDGLRAAPDSQGAFAASNSSLAASNGFALFGTGGSDGAYVYSLAKSQICVDDCRDDELNLDGRKDTWAHQNVPVGEKAEAAGVFAIGARSSFRDAPRGSQIFVLVGGNYSKPGEGARTAAWSVDGANSWTAAANPPHGFRSSVAWSGDLKAWIAAGTNGSDISRDDGKTWTPMDDGDWNALSLPFVVGPKGRIARLFVGVKKQ